MGCVHEKFMNWRAKLHIIRIEKREMCERIEGYRGREGWWLGEGRRPAGRWVDSGGGRAEGAALEMEGTSIPEGKIIYSAQKFLKGKKGRVDELTDWLERTVSIKKDVGGHKVYVNGQEVEGVKTVVINMEAQTVPTVTLEITAPNIEVEYDNRVYRT